MTDDEQRRDNLAQEVITACLTRELDAANEQAMDAVGSEDAENRRAAARQAKERLELWRTRRSLDNETAQAVAQAVLEEVEDAEKLVIYVGALLKDVERHQDARQRAAVTRQWLRDHGYDIPDYEREPGL
ncbi:hypothetical protein [Streptomyces sp. NL15-2K]|uniref:hypothetical protein n=1 Tax=Streptomyces sp. NL15-2K TaxID=376149 RepID=UPI000F5882C4|nr:MULTISPECIES: hypothetical protein [Actinomycetes]WKX14238.1 hypothetical protein Q4V64_44670 [Kutzneria buriramensis]GCB43908.1 hypothetical protein SNL152K_1193 [Streptomyces sp. NL15-2K]